MKTILCSIAIFIFSNAFSQDITGSWNGLLKVPGGQLTFVLNVARTEAGYSATADSPDQGAKGIPVQSVSFQNDTLLFSIPAMGITYKGISENTIFKGIFSQGGHTFPLDLSRKKVQVVRNRPQEPVKPYPYLSEEVTFRNEKENISLAGTLTLPEKEGNYPAVVLITGSGPQNRDSEVFGHKPFLVLSDHLTRNGIAVLRFDDRGTAKSGGMSATATSADFATDIEAAVNYLLSRKEINKKKIGLIGHSEGGTIAPLVAEKNSNISFIVLMAGPGLPGGELMVQQNYDVSRIAGMTEEQLAVVKTYNKEVYSIIKEEKNQELLKEKLLAFADKRLKPRLMSQNLSEEEIKKYISRFIAESSSPWFTYFIRYNPAPVLEKVKCPVLALNGDKDIQVAATENLSAIKNALEKGGNKNVTIKNLHGLNHLFQECTTGSVSEYQNIEQTISPVALNEITGWIVHQAYGNKK